MLSPARHLTLRTGSKLPCAATLSPTCLLPPITSLKKFTACLWVSLPTFQDRNTYDIPVTNGRFTDLASAHVRASLNSKDPVQIRLFYYISDSFQLKRRAYSCSDLTSQVLADLKHITSVNPRVSVSIAVYSEGFKPITNLAVQ